jgi:hypothetical protein
MVKKPSEINLYPLDVKKDEEDEGLWFYVPKWIVRAYKLKCYGTNMGKIKFIIKDTPRAMYEYMHEEDGKSYYFKKNWANKLNRERKKELKNGRT